MFRVELSGFSTSSHLSSFSPQFASHPGHLSVLMSQFAPQFHVIFMRTWNRGANSQLHVIFITFCANHPAALSFTKLDEIAESFPVCAHQPGSKELCKDQRGGARSEHRSGRQDRRGDDIRIQRHKGVNLHCGDGQKRTVLRRGYQVADQADKCSDAHLGRGLGRRPVCIVG